MLTTSLAHAFGGGVRARGESYFRERRVRLLRTSSDVVEALVNGSRPYIVKLAREGARIQAACECPYFESDGACKHLWATLLAAEARGSLGTSVRPGKLRLELTEDGSDADADWADEPEDDEEAPGLANMPQPTGLDRLVHELAAHLVGSKLARRAVASLAKPRAAAKPKPPSWQATLAELGGGGRAEIHDLRARLDWPTDRQVVYIIDLDASRERGVLALSVAHRRPRAAGGLSAPSPLRLTLTQAQRLPDVRDVEVLSMLAGASEDHGYHWHEAHRVPEDCCVSGALAERVVCAAAATGRLLGRTGGHGGPLTPVSWDDGGAWTLGARLRRAGKAAWALSATLRRGEEELGLADVQLALEDGLVLAGDRVARLDHGGALGWIASLRTRGPLVVPDADVDTFLANLFDLPALPPLELPEALGITELRPAPLPHLRVKQRVPAHPDRLDAFLSFDYEGRDVAEDLPARRVYDRAARRLVARDAATEEGARARLLELGLRRPPGRGGGTLRWDLAARKLPGVVRVLVRDGWQVEADGKMFRYPSAWRSWVTSGIDWFEVRGEADYAGTTARLPQLLEALARGDGLVRLDDGTFGMLPEDWLKRFGPLAAFGSVEDDHVRFRPSQAALLDALLASEPEVTCDATFARVRDELARFEGVAAAPQPEGFVGQLRDYQRDGLGWMLFLRRMGFGGCLADDMGVGKTAQVLALLEGRRALREGGGEGVPEGPSLVVVPRSLVFNWKQEAARFAPRLRVLDHTGPERSKDEVPRHDVVLTTYGTLRRDAASFRDVVFDYVVLDEAQAIKNAKTASAKAARLLRGRHRLALSGTPIENHLGELWSLFEFLNPGMLGTASVFQRSAEALRDPDAETRQVLARAVRPFILRRTKEQVAKELPRKTEQTVYCELEGVQARLYDELKRHYREELLARVDVEGLDAARMHVLEALLRLRQAACHPGLVDKKRADEPSAKLESLMESLGEVVEGGHAALVFSQFTSFLAIVKRRLSERRIAYEYLDGKTRDRQSRVKRFQEARDCPVFLISLKAGGLGLNLTAADYVFLLDPWWNPAVEAQAIDRTHRIGQTKPVFAYRLIARGTVEEKVLELQRTKRELAAAIIDAQGGMLRDLRREDLELLLS
jgi:hypothetical protein